jgi:hydrogenase maturation protease
LTKVLFVGVGNTLRGDDGVGAYICSKIEKLNFENTAIEKVHQLQTEILETFLQYDKILIVDASISASDVQIEKVPETIAGPISSSHHTNVAALYVLAKRLYQKQLDLYTCAVPVQSFEMGERLSEFAKRNADEAVEKIRKWMKY